MEQIQIQSFGFSELYEWVELPNDFLGRFVTFSKETPDKITLFGANPNDVCLGVTTVNSTIDSDNPTEWHNKYKKNEFGDLFLENERLAVGTKVYDENLELSFIRTYPWEHLIRIETEEYDNTKKFIPRTGRREWIRVNLMGKCIVVDNGECVPGQYCTPYIGKLKSKQGTAIPATTDSVHKFYVLSRISDNTILILNK